MCYLFKVALASSLFFTLTPQWPIHANAFEDQLLSKRLENALNAKDIDPLIDLLHAKEGSELANRYKKFLKSFPNAKWKVKQGKLLKDGRNSLEIYITGKKKIKSNQYSINSRQVLGIKVKEGKIINKEVISEETVIQSFKDPLSIKIQVPEAVLTGTKYDFDVILKKPLGDTILAGGLIDISNEHIRNQSSPNIEIVPLGGGGLFKSVQAPLKAGVQNWAAVLAHPEGLISITKMVRVVSNPADIDL